MSKYVIGVLAHVDSGKTTLNEAILYKSATIRTFGRVDKGNAFLDYNQNEKERGITIYTKEARFNLENNEYVLLDTPGHLDFAQDMERVCKALDYAILVLNAKDLITHHTKTIWQLLKMHNIPTIIFVNKMDISFLDKETLFKKIKEELSEDVIDFSQENIFDDIATQDEEALDEYLNSGLISDDKIIDLIYKRKVFPTIFGSALKFEGIDSLFNLLKTYLKDKKISDDFKAYVYKVSHDANNNTLTHLKIIDGTLKSKQKFDSNNKVDEIRIYNGLKYKVVNEVKASDVCVIKGFKDIFPGLYIPSFEVEKNSLKPFLSYTFEVLDNVNPKVVYDNLKELSIEDPSLKIRLKDNKIYFNLMGNVQKEVLENTILERFKINGKFKNQGIEYKETITKIIEGVGHFEPVRHYAEVHLLLEPLNKNAGVVIESNLCCDLSVNHEKIIIDELKRNRVKGVLTNSELQDIKITLLGAKVSLSHTNSQDLIEATRRALRQGLMYADSVLLEPYANFKIKVLSNDLSKVLFELDKVKAKYKISDSDDEYTYLSGETNVKFLNEYQSRFIDDTKAKGELVYEFKEYHEVENSEEIINEIAYDVNSDFDNSPGSIFFDKGAGFYVPYDKVYEYMQMDFLYVIKKSETSYVRNNYKVSDEEVLRIFEKISPKKEKVYQKKTKTNEEYKGKVVIKDRMLIVDGYNVLYGIDEYNAILKDNLANARDKLINDLKEYQHLKGTNVIVVFDAYRVKGLSHIKSSDKFEIVYTKEGETADTYIEKSIKKLLPKYTIMVASNDNPVINTTFFDGATRISIKALMKEYEMLKNKAINKHKIDNLDIKNQPLSDLKEKFYKD